MSDQDSVSTEVSFTYRIREMELVEDIIVITEHDTTVLLHAGTIFKFSELVDQSLSVVPSNPLPMNRNRDDDSRSSTAPRP